MPFVFRFLKRNHKTFTTRCGFRTAVLCCETLKWLSIFIFRPKWAIFDEIDFAQGTNNEHVLKGFTLDGGFSSVREVAIRQTQQKLNEKLRHRVIRSRNVRGDLDVWNNLQTLFGAISAGFGFNSRLRFVWRVVQATAHTHEHTQHTRTHHDGIHRKYYYNNSRIVLLFRA